MQKMTIDSSDSTFLVHVEERDGSTGKRKMVTLTSLSRREAYVVVQTYVVHPIEVHRSVSGFLFLAMGSEGLRRGGIGTVDEGAMEICCQRRAKLCIVSAQDYVRRRGAN